MAKSPPSDAQLEFLRALWALGEARVGEVQEHLRRHGRALATSTVSTILSRLEAKALVARRTVGRQFVYRAAVSEDEIRRTALSRMSDGLFGGDVPAMVSQLLDVSDVSAEQIAEVKRLVDRHAVKTRSSRTARRRRRADK